ncbi:MAG: two-component regulator propeller domain-containing protein [Lentimicrobium sp.]
MEGIVINLRLNNSQLMKSGFIIILFYLLWSATFCLKAQHPVYRHFTVDDGLPSNEIYHIFQDAKGYIWVATNMGVCRYDGINFQNFDKQDGLPENTVFEIYEDSKGRVWFISFPCQLSYFINESIHSYKFNEVIKNQIGSYAVPVKYSFEVSDKEEIKLGLMYEGLISIDNRGILKKLHTPGKDSKSAQLYITDNRVLVSQAKSMDLYNITLHDGKRVNHYHFDNLTKNYAHRQLMAIKNGPDQVVFMQNDLIISFNRNQQPQVKFMNFRVFGIYPDRKGNIWVAADKNGAFLYRNGDFVTSPVKHMLKDISVSAVYEDTEGGMWFATLGNGLFYLPSASFTSFSSDEGLSENSINSVVIRGNDLILGTNDEYVNLLSENKLSLVKISDTKNDRIQDLYVDENDVLWIGTNEYMYSLNPQGAIRKFHNYKDLLTDKSDQNKGSRKIFSIKTFSKSIDGGFWIGESQNFSKFMNNHIVYNSLAIDNIGLRTEALLQLDDSSLFIGALNGLWEFKNSKIVSLSKINTLLGSRITDLKFSKELNLLCIGTKGSGILIYNLKDSVNQITKTHGLSSNSVSSLLLIKNHLWVATNYGLNEMNIEKIGSKDFKITSYFKHNGLVSNEINQIAGDSTNIYIATNQGLTIFDYYSYKPVRVPPPIYISAFGIMKKDTTIKSGLKLRSSQNLITIKFIGISFREASSLKYKYRLKGLDSKWNYTSNTEVEYAFLPPGTFDFEVLAINSEGIMSDVPATISFTIMPPFWKTWWFILIVTLALAAGSYFYYINRLKQIKKEHELRNDIDWYRQQALAKQMDPHFVFNTLNSIQSFIIKNDRLASSQYLSKFARLMRLMLNSSQKQAVPLSDEISALTLYLELESLRFQQKFEYNLVVDLSIDSSACFIPAFLIQPFVENAIWHGIMGLEVTGRIDIEFQKDLNKITCIVEDNGIGRQRSMELKTPVQKAKQSYGIALVVSRLELLNNLYNIDMKIQFVDLFAENGQPSGTRVIIQLPMIS